MSDEELVFGLREAGRKRDGFKAVMLSELAADRIEELLAERKKAVDAFVDLAIATLSQIKSGVATTPYGLEGESHD